jgi:hypothetical protein
MVTDTFIPCSPTSQIVYSFHPFSLLSSPPNILSSETKKIPIVSALSRTSSILMLHNGVNNEYFKPHTILLSWLCGSGSQGADIPPPFSKRSKEEKSFERVKHPLRDRRAIQPNEIKFTVHQVELLR